MLSDADKLRLQAGFDGVLSPHEWQQLQDEFADSSEAGILLAELGDLKSRLDDLPLIDVPPQLAANIKSELGCFSILSCESGRVDKQGYVQERRRIPEMPRPAVNWVVGMALAASLIMAVSLSMHLLEDHTVEAGMQAWMSGSLLDTDKLIERRRWHWAELDGSATLIRDNDQLVLDLELDASIPLSNLVLEIAGSGWQWKINHTDAAVTIGRSAAGEQLRMAVDGSWRKRFMLEPVTTDGEYAQDLILAPQIRIALQRDGQPVNELIIGPG
ncbi:MAG: hypothetical protein ACK5ME_12950 [Parahaliea sp.]